MAAITSNVEKTPAPSRPGKLTKIFLILVFLLIAFILYKGLYQPDNPADHGWWLAGTGWLALGSLLMIPLVFPPGLRRLAVFLWLNLLLAIVISAFIQSQLVGNAQIVRTIRNSNLLMFMLGGFVESVIWSFVLGVILALLVTGVPLLILAYVASTYILALHGIEGVSRWDAMWCVVALILDVNLPFLVVQDGQSLLTKAAGKLGIIGGAGHLVVKQGNVAVLERGGKITRVVNAGVTKLRLLETIRNIFALGPQTRSGEIEHVLTKDRIPLKVSLTIKVQIEPASVAEKRPESRIAPSGEALTRKLDDGLYQVYEGTIMKAALTSQATSFAKLRIDKCEEQKCLDVEQSTWLKAAASLPEGELRDHIMSHRFDELFELVDSAPGEKPEIRVNKRKIYEIEQAILEAIRLTRTGVLGVMVRAVDIGKIEFPKEAKDLLVSRWGAPWTQQIDLIGAETTVQSGLLEAQGELDIAELGARARVTRVELLAQAIVIRARAKAQARILEGQGEGEARAAFFREVLREMRREGALGDDEMVAAVINQLISAMVSVDDLETFVKATASLQRSSLKHSGWEVENATSGERKLERSRR
jgi:regulator of protease activity HflC (stomatin/prohibitin superfamily)